MGDRILITSQTQGRQEELFKDGRLLASLKNKPSPSDLKGTETSGGKTPPSGKHSSPGKSLTAAKSKELDLWGFFAE